MFDIVIHPPKLKSGRSSALVETEPMPQRFAKHLSQSQGKISDEKDTARAMTRAPTKSSKAGGERVAPRQGLER